MIRLLLSALLLAAPAFAGSRKTTVPQIGSLNLPAAVVGGAAPVIDVQVAPGLAALPAAAQVPDLQAQSVQLAPQAQALPTAQDPVRPVDAANPAAVQTAASLTQLSVQFAAPESLDDLDLSPLPGHTYMPSPADWRDESVYSIMIDRFAKKGGKTHGDPRKGDTRHGGNLAGLKEKMGYIRPSTIMLSPVAKSLPEAYHNYAPISLLEVDPYFGTMQDMKEATAEAHRLGKRVILDIVINHTGPVFEYEGGPSGSAWQPVDQPRKKIGYWTEDLKPAELKDTERFTMRGVIDDWDDKDQSLYGDFPPNYRHLRTDDRATQDMIIKVAKWWIKETDIDGFRLDAVKHVDPAFIRRFRLEIKEYAASLGKDKFFFLGENSSGRDHEIQQTLDLGVDSAYAYPEYRRVNWALHGKAPAKDLKDSVEKSLSVLGSAAGRLTRFIDLHDTYRFLREGEDPRVLKAALAFLIFSIGIPLLWMGTEQGFRQKEQRLSPEGPDAPADPQNREDMFPEGLFKSESSSGDNFNVETDMYKWTDKLLSLREKHAALRRGDHWVRHADDGPGIYAFSRIHEGHEIVVVMNTSEQVRSAGMFVDANLHKAADVFADELDAGYSASAYDQDGGRKLFVNVPAKGVRVLVRRPAE